MWLITTERKRRCENKQVYIKVKTSRRESSQSEPICYGEFYVPPCIALHTVEGPEWAGLRPYLGKTTHLVYEKPVLEAVLVKACNCPQAGGPRANHKYRDLQRSVPSLGAHAMLQQRAVIANVQQVLNVRPSTRRHCIESRAQG